MRVLEVIRRLFAGKYACDPADVELTATLDDLNIAPFERRDMLMTLGTLYRLDIDPQTAAGWQTVEDIVEYIEDRLPENATEEDRLEELI